MQQSIQKTSPKTFKIHTENDAGNFENVIENTTNLAICGSHFWIHLLETFGLLRIFCAISFSEPSRGTPNGDFGCQNKAKGYKQEPTWRPKGTKMMQRKLQTHARAKIS